MEEYGLGLTSFYVNEISTPEDDPSVGKIKEALSKRAEMEIIGYNYQQEDPLIHWKMRSVTGMRCRFCDGSRNGTWNGIGVGREMGNQFSSMAQNIDLRGGYRKSNSARSVGAKSWREQSSVPSVEAVLISKERHCTQCGTVLEGNLRFCPECGKRLGGRKYKMLIMKKILSVVGIIGGTFFLLGCSNLRGSMVLSIRHMQRIWKFQD